MNGSKSVLFQSRKISLGVRDKFSLDCKIKKVASVMKRLLNYKSNRLSVYFSHVSDQIENFIRVTDFIVIPRNNFYKCVG